MSPFIVCIFDHTSGLKSSMSASINQCTNTQNTKTNLEVRILELITFENLAAERLRLMEFDNWLIIAMINRLSNALIVLQTSQIYLYGNFLQMIDSKVRNMNHYLENPFPEMSFIELYCPQSFSGGGLYLKVKWLLWSVYDGLLWSVKREWVTLVYGLY